MLSNVTVRSTQSKTGFIQSLTVVAFANSSGAGASALASAATGGPSVSLVTTRPGSYIFAVGNDWDKAAARTPAAGQSIVHQYLAAAGDTFWVQNTLNPVAGAGSTVQMSDTAPTADRWNYACVEITR